MRLPPEVVRGVTPLLVLRALADGEAADREVLQRIQELGGGLDVAEGTIYPVLYRLEARRLLSAAWRAGAGVRSQRVYRLTDAGAAELARERRSWAAVIGALTPFLAR